MLYGESQFLNRACNMAKRTSKSAFTLIEILVVISVIALLLAIIIPAMSRAKWLTYRVMCVGHLRQSVLGCTVYAGDNDDMVPPGFDDILHACIYWHKDTQYNLPAMITPYVDEAMEVWTCPNVSRRAPPLNDEMNRKDLGNCYGSYLYFAGRKYPAFGDPEKAVPQKLSRFRPTQPLIQDRIAIMKYRMSPRYHQVNHPARSATFHRHERNPSVSFFEVSDEDEMNGACIGFIDGHAEWFHKNELTDVGFDADGLAGGLVFSVMP